MIIVCRKECKQLKNNKIIDSINNILIIIIMGNYRREGSF